MGESVAGSMTAIIPARGGSKRILRKNVKPFLGLPLITRTIAVVQASHLFDRVVVSTDDEEIARVAVDAGADVPFRRPSELSDDHTDTRTVIQHTIGQLEEASGSALDLVCAVYATAVFATPDDLADSAELLRESGVGYVFAATTFPAPIQRALRRLPDGSCEMFQPEHRYTRSQDLEEAYHDAGQFYWAARDTWMSETPIFGAESRLYVLPRWRVQDIDTPEDWHRAELMLRLPEVGS